MKFFGFRIIREEEYQSLIQDYQVAHKVLRVRRWFSGWKDLDIIWDYLFDKSREDVSPTRQEYARARGTDEYGNVKLRFINDGEG